MLLLNSAGLYSSQLISALFMSKECRLLSLTKEWYIIRVCSLGIFSLLIGYRVIPGLEKFEV